MTYDEALKYIHGTHKFGVKLGLDNVAKLLELLDNPHQKLKYVHVAGTNGKGSTVAFISSILIEAGYKVGIYTSPYIEHFTERISINHKEISEGDLARITEYIKGKVQEMVSMGYNHPTEFEIVTAIAFQYYYENKCDIVVLEVGLGGRYDSTNIIGTPLVSVITSISYDHMSILGNTLSKIAFEKAGIIKKDGDVVLYPQSQEVEEVIAKTCEEMHSTLRKADFSKIISLEYGADGQYFNCGLYEGLKTKLLGEHQLKNAAVAITACEVIMDKECKITENTGCKITVDAIRNGIKKATWPGRMEIVSKQPLFLIDGAHNEDGARVMVDTLLKYFPGKRKVFIMGVLKDKEYEKIVEIVAPIANQFITVTPLSDRALPSDDLAETIKRYCKNVIICDKIEKGIETSLRISDSNAIICAFGSLYYIGEVRRYFELIKLTI
ncbi:MAG TPA: folylpolyglutamate synthase/dihydrofolate synthase family protein [Clostridiales bacterium]|nr:folylpolyglutamate synthase/dihydrofolate synthase family protein [Clostridiales bacterium]